MLHVFGDRKARITLLIEVREYATTMFRRRVWTILTLAWIALTAPAFGQFYAPDTEFHDLAQRCFVVEASRVLAWRDNDAGATKYAQVTFDVQTRPNQDTAWKIQWLDSRSNILRQTTVTYPDSLLRDGPSFYRSVFKQLWSLQWRAVEKSSGTNAAAEFWHGVNEAGYSRLETLQVAWKLKQSSPKLEHGPAHLAGLLQGTALPAIGGALSIDALLLARSAAWLCLAEMSLNDASPMDSCWAPTLFLAGRDNAAVALWKNHPKDAPLAQSSGPVSHGWNFLLQRPRAKAGFVYAAAKEHRRFAMPMMVFHCGTADLGTTLGTAMYAIFASDKEIVSRLYDYSPHLSLGSGVSGGRVTEGMWPTLARQAWLDALHAQPLSGLDYSGHAKLIDKSRSDLKTALRAGESPNSDASVIGLSAMSPILSEAYTEGLGPLIPTAVVTARDLLQYGWESTCVNLETRHRFVSRTWGVRDLAASIATNSSMHVKGSSTFFLFPASREPGEMVARLRRMQFADTSSHALRSFPFPIWSADPAQNPQFYWRRCWLRPWLIGQQVSGLLVQHQDQVVPFLSRFHTEGGAAGDATALHVLVNNTGNAASKIPGRQKLQEELARSLIEPSILQLNTTWEQKYEKLPFFERGQELEKVFWDAPDIGIHGWIFHNYLMAHADTSAKRFYGQVAGVVGNSINFANGIGQMRYALAALDGDRAAMKQALADSNSGSLGNMRMLVWEAVITDNAAALRRQLDEAIERYPSSAAQMRRLKGFLPLLPALADPKHADRKQALDYFVNDSQWTFLQWILIRKHGLPVKEAVQFLGGTETDGVRQVMISFLNKDKIRFEEQYEKISRTDGYTMARLVLLLRLRKDLLELQEPSGQLDLKLAKAQTVEQAMLEALEKE